MRSQSETQPCGTYIYSNPPLRLEMPNGKRRGRGGHASPQKNVQQDHVAKPKVSELPDILTIRPHPSDIPDSIRQAFPEFRASQPFWSGLEQIMPEYAGSPDAYKKCWVGLPEHNIDSIERSVDTNFTASIVLKTGEHVPVFVKRIHLLDPVTAMEGGYVYPANGGLPAASELWKTALGKINDPLNEAYVDALFANCASLLASHAISPHWCKCYGTWTARVEKYMYDITEEYESMKNEPWWRKNQKLGLFSLVKDEEATHAFLTEGLTDISQDDFTPVDIDEPVDRDTMFAVEDEPEIDADDTPLVLKKPKVSLRRVSSDSETESDDDTDDETSDAFQQFVEFTDFPVQVTLLEKADGTMDELLNIETSEILETKEARWTAWLFQVIAGLTVAQYYYGFVHNDLHTNNIMWSATEQSHIYYKIKKGKNIYYYAVPTFGKIMKIIDFGRATFHLPDPAGFIISDAFYPGNDAATQYNCEPFYNSREGKRVEPNPSFDLCRLAVSLLEALYPEKPTAISPVKIMSREGPKIYPETTSHVYNMLWEWLTDDEGKNVLMTPNGKERYPDFDLYRALASDVHRAVPVRQIEKSIFQSYKVSHDAIPHNANIYDLHI